MADSELEVLRDAIDAVDRDLVVLLARRRDLVRRIAGEKRALGMPPFDAAREERVRVAMRAVAAELGVPESSVDALAAMLLDDGRREVAARYTPADPERS